MTVEEFLAWEERQERRYEFDGLRPVAMTGGTLAHDAITTNVHGSRDPGAVPSGRTPRSSLPAGLAIQTS